ncbi:MAG: hypothetical protein IT307_06740 [Chloroflexi bacterium]|nr:hypothetical protein [Chloroflexota bacterium]
MQSFRGELQAAGAAIIAHAPARTSQWATSMGRAQSLQLPPRRGARPAEGLARQASAATRPTRGPTHQGTEQQGDHRAGDASDGTSEQAAGASQQEQQTECPRHRPKE